jgi:hypothetical protein
MRLIPVCTVFVLCLAFAAQAAPGTPIHCTPPQLWARDFGAPPRIPFVGDADGDGYADLVCLYPVGSGIIDLSANASGWKSMYPFQLLREFGENGIGAVGGRFTDPGAFGVLAVFGDGSVRLAHSISEDYRRYERNDIVTTFATPPASPVLMASGDVHGDGRDEAVLVDAEGGVWLITLSGRRTIMAQLREIGSLGRSVGAIAMGDITGDGRAELIHIDRRGTVYATPVGPHGLGTSWRLMRAEPGAALCVGNINGSGLADIVVGTKVIWDGDPRRVSDWPELAASGPGKLAAGDINGNGRDDLIRFTRRGNEPSPIIPGQEYYSRHAVYVHFTYFEGDPDPDNDGLTNEEEALLGTDPLNRDTSGDGILDGWAVKGFRGLDLPGLGVSPLRKSVICYLQPLEGVDREVLEREAGYAKRYFSGLGVTNPDGSRGINFVPIIADCILKSEGEGKGWGELGTRFFPQQHRGIAHWMMVTPGGGGQARQMGDMGTCGINSFHAVFLHEFGHQLGLDHTGFWGPTQCPTYTSLMNYAYGYSFAGRREFVHYSSGVYRDLVLLETNLSEVLPYNIRNVRFLAEPPYRFNLREDGDNTLIDWNWNGVFGEEGVKADINYAYSIVGGIRQTVCKSLTAPLLVAHRDRELLLIYGREAKSGNAVADEPGSEQQAKDMSLVYRRYLGDEKWSDAVVISESGLTGDPTAVSDGKSVWLFHPSERGVVVRQLQMEDGKWRVGEPEVMPGTIGMEASPAVYQDRLCVFLWAGPGEEVAVIWREGGDWSSPQSLGFTSTFPVGAVTDTIKGDLLIGCGEDQDERRPSRWQIRRLILDTEGTLEQTDWEWIEGEDGSARGNLRPTLLFDDSTHGGPDGKIRFIAGGLLTEQWHWVRFFAAEQIADRTEGGGWKIKRYYDEWTQTRSTPAAAVFQDSVTIAYRWVCGSQGPTDNDLHVAYSGLGIDSEPMGDHDDVSYIADIGLRYSILYKATKE